MIDGLERRGEARISGDSFCLKAFELEEEEEREHGIAPEGARYAALRAFGNPRVISEQTREVWSWDRLETLLRDLRILIRSTG